MAAWGMGTGMPCPEGSSELSEIRQYATIFGAAESTWSNGGGLPESEKKHESQSMPVSPTPTSWFVPSSPWSHSGVFRAVPARAGGPACCKTAADSAFAISICAAISSQSTVGSSAQRRSAAHPLGTEGARRRTMAEASRAGSPIGSVVTVTPVNSDDPRRTRKLAASSLRRSSSMPRSSGAA